jgi:hypothetical protein
LGAITSKSLNRIAKIGYVHLNCSQYLSFCVIEIRFSNLSIPCKINKLLVILYFSIKLTIICLSFCYTYFSLSDGGSHYFSHFEIWQHRIVIIGFCYLSDMPIWLSLCKIVRSSVMLLIPLFTITMPNVTAGGIFFPRGHCNLVALLKQLW